MSKNKGFSITSAGRYSLALYELASENNVLSQVEDQSLSILNLISSSKDFSNFIKDPTNSQKDLVRVIENISNENNFESLLKSFLNFLVPKRRFFYIEQILKNFLINFQIYYHLKYFLSPSKDPFDYLWDPL